MNLFSVGEWPTGGWRVASQDEYSGGMSAKCFGVGDEGRAKAEAFYEAMTDGPTCRHCGNFLLFDRDYGSKSEVERRENEHVCFRCDCTLKLLAISDTSVRVNGFHYTISPDQPKSYRGFVGHGGAKFVIKFFDERGEVITRNLWAQGRIPDWFRALMPDNASFVRHERGHDSPYAGFGAAVTQDETTR